MLLIFHSKAAAEVLMLAQHAAPLLRAAGKVFDQQVPARGVWTAAQLSGAIAGIERAVAHAADEMAQEEDEPVPAMERSVSLRQRAWPLLDMLKRAQEKGVDVMWEVA